MKAFVNFKSINGFNSLHNENISKIKDFFEKYNSLLKQIKELNLLVQNTIKRKDFDENYNSLSKYVKELKSQIENIVSKKDSLECENLKQFLIEHVGDNMITVKNMFNINYGDAYKITQIEPKENGFLIHIEEIIDDIILEKVYRIELY